MNSNKTATERGSASCEVAGGRHVLPQPPASEPAVASALRLGIRRRQLPWPEGGPSGAAGKNGRN